MPIAKKKTTEATVLRLVPPAPQPVTTDKYHALFEQASDAIMTVFPDGRVDEANRALQELTGYTKGEIEGKNIQILFPVREKNHLPERTRAFCSNHLEGHGTFEDIAILRQDAYVRVVELGVRRVQSNEGELTLLLFRDVTEKKKMERELLTKHTELKNAYVQLEKNNIDLKAMQNTLVQCGKMAALGELTAGIAHELNQPLQGIRGYAQELESLLSPTFGSTRETLKNQQIQDSLNEVIRSVDKMAKIITYMRNFTRKSTEGTEWVDVSAVIDDALKMMHRQLEVRGIAIQCSLAGLPQVFANPVQIEQVVINLITNARDAIEETGRGKGAILVTGRIQDRFVEIDFKDDGVGMSDGLKTKAFNPFFTTKEVGKGMGLGLSLSYGILNRIQGAITVQSELGKGSTFTVRLPIDYRELG